MKIPHKHFCLRICVNFSLRLFNLYRYMYDEYCIVWTHHKSNPTSIISGIISIRLQRLRKITVENRIPHVYNL